MTTVGEARDPAVTREELHDLSSYLDGLPDDVRGTAAFSAYEQRVGELSRELVLAEMVLKLHLPASFGADHIKTTEYVSTCESLSLMAQRYEQVAERSLKTRRALQWAVVAVCAGAALAALTTAAGLVASFSGVAGVLAICVGWLAERTRKLELAARCLVELCEEMAHSFGPSGQVLRQSEFYAASTRRIEALLSDIEASGDSEARPAPGLKSPIR
jgi:hypothetical protein